MEEEKIVLKFKRLKTKELSGTDYKMYNYAILAAKCAYAPYSNFNVGAAVLFEGGEIVYGNNQENIAYPSGLCAERVALFSAGATHPEKPVIGMAIVAMKNGVIQPSIAPCGACRQVMLETEQRYRQTMRILLCGKDETIIIPLAKDLLPFSFSEM